VQATVIVVIVSIVRGYAEQREVPPWAMKLRSSPNFALLTALAAGLASLAVFAWVPTFKAIAARALFAAGVATVAGAVVVATWVTPLQVFNYRDRVAAGTAEATWTIIPWSPSQRGTNQRLLPPGSDPASPDRWQYVLDQLRPLQAAAEQAAQEDINEARTGAIEQALAMGRSERAAQAMGEEAALRVVRRVRAEADAEHIPRLLAEAEQKFPSAGLPRYTIGTDSIGQDVLSNMLHACRLSISIGLVSTGIAVVIGVTIGALMGYFGGWVDTLLFRVVEIFMAIPVLFLLIVAAAVLPRNTYVMMAIIGCVTWTGAARFTRAEFMRLRNQDFVQGAQAVGLPLRSILFKHMLPNGVTPVLVDASFAIAAAIQIEAILSFLALGPAEQPSWGRLLASATNEVGEFKWWLAVFPGFAIFLTALSYNILGEALRDAIDPKLKKARV
jgi:ABC-type dipeptide/oligopeptide/nickel transport system permease subunit